MPINSNGLAPSTAPFNRQKGAHISAASNGFVVSLDNQTNYDQTYKIAINADEVAEIIKAYFSQE